MLQNLKKANEAVKRQWMRFLEALPAWLSPWVRDFADVAKTVFVAIVILKLLFGADMLVPLVVVTSTSMVHESGDNSWMTWMTSRDLAEETIDSFPLGNGFNMGDMILVNNPEAELGDVIIYERDRDHLQFESRDPIIHRVVGVIYVEDYIYAGSEGVLDCITEDGITPYIAKVKSCQDSGQDCVYTRYPETGTFKFFITKGDHNAGSDQCSRRLNISYPVNEKQVTGKALLRLPYIGWLKLLLNYLLQIPIIISRILTLQI